MRIFFGLLLLALASGSANETIIQIAYTGTYSGTIPVGNPAIGQFTTTQVDSAPFDLLFTFNTLTPRAFYTDTPTGSELSSFFVPSVGNVGGTFSVGGSVHAEDTATIGSTSQVLVDQT